MTKILLVNHSLSKHCGIHSHGVRMGNILAQSKIHEFIYCEANSLEEFSKHVDKIDPNIVIYNYTSGVLGWAQLAHSKYKSLLHLALIHDVTPEDMVESNIGPFDFRIALDPTLKESDKWFTTVRPLFGYTASSCAINKIPTIGSFGFYFRHKNFNKIIENVSNEFTEAIVNIHLTKAKFSTDATKREMDMFIEWAHSVVKNTGISLNITSNYITDKGVIDFLSNNDVNILEYSGNYGSGPSSAIDYCVAAGRAIMISGSYQFRHVYGLLPETQKVSISEAIGRGNKEVLKLQDEWSEDNYRKDYERIIYEVQNR